MGWKDLWRSQLSFKLFILMSWMGGLRNIGGKIERAGCKNEEVYKNFEGVGHKNAESSKKSKDRP